MPPELEPDIDARLAVRIRTLRAERNLTLDALADLCAVSRAMLSRIERGESSPTAHLLARICGGLGITVAAMFSLDRGGGPVARREAQPVWRDPGSGYLRRAVSPPSRASCVALAEICLPAGASVAFDAMGLDDAEQHVWLLGGTLMVSVGDTHHQLETGDCLAMRLDAPVRFASTSDQGCRYAVITSRRASTR